MAALCGLVARHQCCLGHISASSLRSASPKLRKPFCTGRSWSPRHLTKRRGPPSQTAYEVSCRAGPWKWSRNLLPGFVSPFLCAFGGRSGGWFPRARRQEGRPASAASPFEDKCYRTHVLVRFKRLDCNGGRGCCSQVRRAPIDHLPSTRLRPPLGIVLILCSLRANYAAPAPCPHR